MKTVTISEAASIKGVARYAIHAAIKTGKLKTVEVNVPQVRVTLASLNGYQPNKNMKRAGRKPSNSKAELDQIEQSRRYCPKCEASITSTDAENRACTQCGAEVK